MNVISSTIKFPFQLETACEKVNAIDANNKNIWALKNMSTRFERFHPQLW